MANTPTETKPDSDLDVSLTGSNEDGQHVTVNREDALQSIFGTKHPKMAEALLSHCFKVLKSNEASDEHKSGDERSFMVSVIAELKPRDTVERMLAVQMAATHVAMIRSGGWLAHSDTIEQVKAHYSG